MSRTMTIDVGSIDVEKGRLVFVEYDGDGPAKRVRLKMDTATAAYLAECLWRWHRDRAAELERVKSAMEGRSCSHLR